MNKYHVRIKGEKEWQERLYSGFDHYMAAESAAEWEFDQEGGLSQGDQLILEIRQYGSDEIRTVAVYAETVIRYHSRDLNSDEREKHDV